VGATLQSPSQGSSITTLTSRISLPLRDRLAPSIQQSLFHLLGVCQYRRDRYREWTQHERQRFDHEFELPRLQPRSYDLSLSLRGYFGFSQRQVTMTADEWPPTTTPKRDDVLATSRTVLLGSKQGGNRQSLVIGLALGLFALTFLAYELDIVSHSGGVVFVPFYAAFIGLTAAFWTGYGQIGLLSGWALTYITFLGWRTEWATGISPRPLTERIAYIVQPDGLVVLAIIGIGVTVIGFIAGTIARKGIDRLQAGS
jgi:hypothetical protein